jgi:chemotaxis protein MotA
VDIATIAGILVALAAFVGGHQLESAQLGALLQPAAALVVLGGTAGALAVQFPGHALRSALGRIGALFRPSVPDPGHILSVIVGLARKARRDGLFALERDAAGIEEPFLKRAVEMAIDGSDPRSLRAALELAIRRSESEGEYPVRVFEAAGRHAPAFGLVAAVLCFTRPGGPPDGALLGQIGAALVAVGYGVLLAHALCLPVAGKLRWRLRERLTAMELVVEGVCALAEGDNPRLIERKLIVYCRERHGGSRSEVVVAARAAA